MNAPYPVTEGTLPATLGFVRIIEMVPGRARIEYRVGDHMCHSGGIAQGGFVAGWIDAAMAHAAMAKFGTDRVAMTLEMKISYFAPTNPGLVIAEGWLESGSSTLFAEGRLLDTDGKVLAKGSSTIRMIDMKRVAGMTGG
jgi:uncharacterized protein (TIGR00369 family)